MTVPHTASANPFILTELSSQLAEALCTWRYPSPFDFYNWSSWEIMQQLGIEFGDAYIRNQQYAAALDAEGNFIGFAQFFPLLGVTRIGLGLRPDLCGQGLGLPFVQAITQRHAIVRQTMKSIWRSMCGTFERFEPMNGQTLLSRTLIRDERSMGWWTSTV